MVQVQHVLQDAFESRDRAEAALLDAVHAQGEAERRAAALETQLTQTVQPGGAIEAQRGTPQGTAQATTGVAANGPRCEKAAVAHLPAVRSSYARLGVI